MSARAMLRRTPAAARRHEPRGTHLVRVALAGCGVVGSSLVSLARGERERLESAFGVRLQFVRVLVREAAKARAVTFPRGVVTTDVGAFLAARADVVVEAIGGLDPASRIARESLEAGRSVVSANKTLVASEGENLLALARGCRATLDFEAAVGGGVPIVRTLRSALGGHGVRTITGILNGTTNYLLTRIADGASFGDALREAQANGFAEADPSRDLEGLDSADKIRILAWLTWGIPPSEVRVAVEPLPADPAALVRSAAARNGALRYLAGALRDPDGAVHAWVRPVIVPAQHEFASVRDEENAIHVESESLGLLRLQGRGAGGRATASALLADVVHVAQRRRQRATGR